LNLERIQPLLAFIRHGLNLVDGLRDVEHGRRWGRSAVLPHGRLLFDHVPPIFAGLLSLIGAILVLRVFMRALIEELWVDLHKHLHSVVHHAVDSSIPMSLGVFVERSEHDRENSFHIITDEIAEIFIVPEIEGTLGNLEMWTSDRLSQLVEERFLNFGEFSGVHNLEDIFDFVEVHDLLGAVCLRPVTQQSKNDLRRREVSILRTNREHKIGQ
jgi:hypothetical protein